MENNRAQTTIFVIIGILIVATVILFLVLREPDVSSGEIPANLEAPYISFLSCLEDELDIGVSLLEQQGGYIELPEFDTPSVDSPFSNQFDFLGTTLPYWYYVSSSGIAREQVPSLELMEEQLADFLEGRMQTCSQTEFTSQGFDVALDEQASFDIIISSDSVRATVDVLFSLSKGDVSWSSREHMVSIPTALGQLHESSITAYNRMQSDLLLESYGIDSLWLYAPVDGVELSCSPLVWNAQTIFEELSEGIEVSTLSLSTMLPEDNYFSVELGVSEEVSFINSRSWPHSYEVLPGEGPVLSANPIGNQEGFGILGFCYVPYHFVYNVKYPVLVQVKEEDEVFQFPVAVVIEGNQAREPLSGVTLAVDDEIEDFCKYANTMTHISTYDVSGGVIDADLYYECSGTSCFVGSTTNGVFSGDFPQCVGGELVAVSKDHLRTTQSYSSLEEGSTDIYLESLYPLNVSLLVDGIASSKEAVIYFSSKDHTTSVYYPQQTVVELTQGDYEVNVQVYGESDITLGATTTQQCVEVPRGGVGAVLGLTKEECYDIEFPETVLSRVLEAGGVQEHYFVDARLENAQTITLSASSLPQVNTLEQVQVNSILFEERDVGVSFS